MKLDPKDPKVIVHRAIYLAGIRDGITTLVQALRESYPDDDWDQVEAQAIQGFQDTYSDKWPEAYLLYKQGQEQVAEARKKRA